MELLIGCKTAALSEVIDFANNNNTGIEVKCFSTPFNLSPDWHGLLDMIKKQLKNFEGALSVQGVITNRPGSWNRMVIKTIKEDYEKSLQVAEELNAKSVIFNSNYFPGLTSWKYKDWLDFQVELWADISKIAEDKGIVVAIENVYDEKTDSILDILKEIKSPNLKGCIDFGHLNLISSSQNFKEWIDNFSGNAYCLHLHNNNGRYDSHKSLLKGSIDYDSLFSDISSMKTMPILAVEVSTLADAKESVDYVNKLSEKHFNI